MKRIILLIFGLAALIIGVTLTLSWWPDVVSLFRGAMGIILAVSGLFMMYSVKIK